MEVKHKFENAKTVMDTCENSQLVLESRKQHIKLAPKYIGNIRKGVFNKLTELLSHPDKILDGFPLAYSNVRAIQNVGKVIADQTCVHFDVEADFIMFKPTVGCKLNGKVNKIAKRHIGCLVHNHFNAWIPHTTVTEKIAADLLMNAEIEFTVQNISTNRNVLSIKGKFEKFLSQKLQKKFNSVTMKPNTSPKKGVADHDDAKNETSTQNGEEMKSPVTKKKKNHRKGPDESSQDESCLSQNNSQLSETTDCGNSGHTPKSKKHKKDKRKPLDENDSVLVGTGCVNESIASVTSCEPLFSSTQVDELNNNNSEKVKGKKHKKKKKHAEIDEVGDDSVVDPNESKVTVERKGNGVDDIYNGGLENGTSSHGKTKNRKRQHEENAFTKLKDNVINDSDLAVPSPVKKLKKHKKAVEIIDYDSSVDFQDNSKTAKKEKKKKKHREKLD